jgi:hypothetical protein
LSLKENTQNNNTSDLVPCTYHIPSVVAASDATLQNGSYIVLMHATSRPPHLALLIDGALFSLSIKGPKLALPLELQLRMIHSKQIPSLFLKLKTALFYHQNQLFKAANAHTMAYSRVEAGVATCLSPIKNFCSGVFEIDTSRVDSIFDLLPLLFEKKLIHSSHHFYLDAHIRDAVFQMALYTMEDIYNSIVQSEGLMV